jgi:hypothetical protein
MPRKIVEPEILENELFDEDYYDARGNVSPGGCYDAGGHLIAERWADMADWLYDQERDRCE